MHDRLFSRSAGAVQLGRFVVLERLGRGGMGVVYAAYDPSLDRRVAVKVLLAPVTEHDASARRRLEREARAMAKLAHPNVVTVHEVGTHEGRVFLAMQYVAGGTLLDWCEQHPRGSAERFATALDLMRQVAEGLAAAHDAGLVHRDLKPHNVLLHPIAKRDSGTGLHAMVADFGLAQLGNSRALDEAPTDEDADLGAGASGRKPALSGAGGSWHKPSDSDASRTYAPTGLTRTGGAVGTPAYMAPEQFDGRADARSDQWGLCATFFEVFYGVRPFPKSTWDAPVQCATEDPATPADRRGVPAWMQRVLQRGLSSDPAARFDSVRALLDAVDREIRPVRRRLPYVAGIGLIGVAIGAVAWNRSDPEPSIEPCSDGRELLEPAVGDARKAAIRDAFAATGEPFWNPTWDRLQVRLDSWANDWSGQYQEACEATRVRRVQTEAQWELRRTCLHQLLEGLQITSDAFAEATAEIVGDAFRVSLSLPPPAECVEPKHTAFGDGTLTIADPEVADITLGLRRVHALGPLNRDDDAIDELDRVQPIAERIGVKALIRDVLVFRAEFAARRGDVDAAEAHAFAALALAEADGDVEAMAKAWNRLAITSESAGDNERGRFRAERALALAAASDFDAGLRAMFLATKATVMTGYAPIEDIVAVQEDALAALITHGGHPHGVTMLQTDLSVNLARAGRVDRALPMGREALRRSVAHLAPGHPGVIVAQAQLAQLLATVGENGEAAGLLEEALASFPEDLAVRTELRIKLTALLAGVLIQMQRWDDAAKLLARLLADTRGHMPAEHPEVAGVQLQLAAIHLETGDPAAARSALESIAKYAADERIDPINHGVYWGNLAEAQVRTGSIEQALESLERSRAAYERGTADDSPWRFSFLVSAAKTYSLADRPIEAVDHFEQALQIAGSTEVEPGDLAEAQIGLAYALVGKSPERAVDLARQARRYYAGLGESGAEDAAQIEEWLQTVQ